MMARKSMYIILALVWSLYSIDITASDISSEKSNAKIGVLYVKTYKTASSTMSGMLYRYGYDNNLTVWKGIFMHCKPISINNFHIVAGHNYCGRKGCSSEQKEKGVCKGLGYQPWMEDKMFHPYIRLVLVAEPRSRLLSSYFYRRMQEQVDDDEDIEFEDDLIKYATKEFTRDRDAVQWHWLADGTETGTLEDVMETLLPKFIVGLTNRFDESLILLRNALGVSSRAIMYANLKTSPHMKRPTYDTLSTKAQEVISQVIRASGDDRFYTEAQRMFDKQLLSLGKDVMASELIKFQHLYTQLRQSCDMSSFDSKTSNNPRYVLRDPRVNCMLKQYDAL